MAVFWIILKVTVYADGVRTKIIEGCHESRSCCLLRRGRRRRAEQVSGGGSRAQRLCLDCCAETVSHLDGDVDLLVGYEILTQGEKSGLGA